MCKKILVIEDEKGIRDYLETCLQAAEYEVKGAASGVEGYIMFQDGLFDLILLDIMLPDINGYEVCRRIRDTSEIPVIMLTAMSEERDQIKGFDALADDYVTKPFSFPVLLKRIKAALRKAPPRAENEHMLVYKDIRLDSVGYEVFVMDKQIIMTGLEFRLLKMLLESRGRVLSRKEIFHEVWREEFYDGSEKIINHHVMNVRKKIDRDYIETIRGVGYKIG